MAQELNTFGKFPLSGRSCLVKTLDFIIIGAQKSGTTSLYRYLQSHPRIYMPPDKEAPFFSDNERLAKGWSWYLNEYFAGAPGDALWGKASPQYMAVSAVPVRIKAQIPSVKLIAILRNPIDRAYSHYKMAVRRGTEQRNFVEALEQLLPLSAMRAARELQAFPEDETRFYLAWGEYGRILGNYLEHFSIEQLKVVFLDDLEQRPQEVLDTVVEFLELPTEYTPANLGRRYHRGGVRRRYTRFRAFLKRTPLIWIWRRLPSRLQRTLSFWYDIYDVVPDGQSRSAVPDYIREKLVKFYRADVQNLEELLGVQVPWSEFHG